MSRLYVPNTRGRQAVFPALRSTRNTSNPDGTYQEKPQRKRRGGAKRGVTNPAKNRGRKIPVSKSVEEESTTSGASADEADEEENDDDDGDENDEPEVIAPSRAFKERAAGRYQYDRSDDNLSEIGDEDSMFNDARLPMLPEVTLDDEEDDEIYQKVDDISESDPENVSQDEMLRLEAELNLNRSLSAATDDENHSAFYLNQIEGMSAYGFGETSEAEESVHLQMSSPSSDDGTPTFQRHVRFEDSFPENKSVFRLSQSPTMTRALLPSALPPQTMTAVVGAEYGAVSDSDSDIDSDVTDDCLPAAALEMSDNEQPPEETTPSSEIRRTPKLKGPPTGRFIDDGDKSAGILDPTGKVLIITNPRNLGEEFARRYGPSAPASPSAGFAEAVFGDEDSQSIQDASQVPDPMMSSLATDLNIGSNGQAMGPPEAWYADFNLMQGILPEDDTDGEGLDAAEQMIALEDVIHFGSDDSDDESPTSPSFMSSDFNLTPRTQVSHLDSTNIMSFRRAADPAFAALQSSPPASSAGFFATPKPPSRNRKRKARNDSPYSTPLYKGVTPVQRTTGFHHGATILMDSPAPSKRRRIMS